MSEDLNTPGRSLFPGYTEIAGMYEREVEGLSDEQIDTVRPEKSWGAWSIRKQVSHIASVHYRHFLGTWGKTLLRTPLRATSRSSTPAGRIAHSTPRAFTRRPTSSPP